MKRLEVRDLDGPNFFLLVPAIKVELDLGDDGGSADSAFVQRVGEQLQTLVARLHRRTAQPTPEIVWRAMDTDGVWSLAFSWNHRRFAMRVAEATVDAAHGHAVDEPVLVAELRNLLGTVESDDAPLWVRDADRAMPIVGITGTNGKTTTTRLLAHVLRTGGKRVGWSSSSGVYIEGEEVLAGDYSGPSGARRVLEEPNLDAAVLETARGGILLRGLAYESNDVSVFVNVSSDHLDLQGIRTVESLAAVKATVVRVTLAEGTSVLNADDPLVMAASDGIRARRFLVSQQPASTAIRAALAAGQRCLIAADGQMLLKSSEGETPLATVADIPITFGGRARHMVENALCAAAAALSLGLSPDAVGAGLRSFRNSAAQNRGRLNVYDVGGVIVILDFAHNEAGLEHLLTFASTWRQGESKLIAVIGSAGDRTDHSLRELGRIAAEQSDAVIAKGTVHYLRGRTLEEIIGLYSEGVASAGQTPPYTIVEDEFHGMLTGIETAHAGDVVAIMCHEQTAEIVAHLETHGRSLS